jgi:hypothetical protein
LLTLFVYQIDEIEKKVLNANLNSDFSHSLGQKQTYNPCAAQVRDGSIQSGQRCDVSAANMIDSIK